MVTFKIKSNNELVKSSYPYGMVFDLSKAPDDFWETIGSDGGGVRVYESDGETELPRGVKLFDKTEKKGLLYFKANGISTSSDTEFVIKATGGSDYADDHEFGLNNVFHSSYKGYFGLNEDTINAVDYTGNDYVWGWNATTDIVKDGGVLGKSTYFGGVNNAYATITDMGKDHINGKQVFTICFILKTDDENWASNWVGPISGGLGKSRFELGSAGSLSHFDTPLDPVPGYVNANLYNRFNFIALTCDGANGYRYFVNGSQTHSGSITGDFTADDAMLVGARRTGSFGTITGWMDEIFFTDGVMSNNELETIYNNRFEQEDFWDVLERISKITGVVPDLENGYVYGIIPESSYTPIHLNIVSNGVSYSTEDANENIQYWNGSSWATYPSAGLSSSAGEQFRLNIGSSKVGYFSVYAYSK